MRVGIDSHIIQNEEDSFLYEYKSTDSNNLSIIEAYAFHNLKVFKNSLKYLVQKNSFLDKDSILFYRFPSDLIPSFTVRYRSYLFKKSFISKFVKGLKSIGDYARKNNIRLSCHAPMTTVLNSEKDTVRLNSIYSINQIAEYFSMMGYKNSFHPFGSKICSHCGSIGGGIDKYIESFKTLSFRAQNLITVENDLRYSIEDLIPIAKYCPLVLDIHHQWLKTGKYLNKNSKVWKKIKKSWKDKVPVIHCSMPQKSLLNNLYEDVKIKSKPEGKLVFNYLPDFSLINKYVPVGKLNKHSDYIWSKSIIDLCKDFNCDVMIEAAMFSLASLNFVINAHKNSRN